MPWYDRSLTIVVVCLFICKTCATHTTVLLDKPIQEVPLLVTSFLFQTGRTSSIWIDRLLGSRAVAFTKNDTLNRDSFQEHDLHDNMEKTKKYLLPIPWSSCSMELLAFVLLDDVKGASFQRFSGSPLVGSARISLFHGSTIIRCIYRSLYDSWRPSPRANTAPNYQAVFVTCPVQNTSHCRDLRNKLNVNSVHAAVLELLRSDHIDHTLRASFRIHTQSPTTKDTLDTRPAACLVLPYQSSNIKATQINQAMVIEWIRHHTSLGFHIFIYDRQGSFQQTLSNNSYAFLRSIHTQSSHINYHPFTIRELLDPKRNGKTFDNNDMNEENRTENHEEESHSYVQSEAMMDVTDDDKTLTLTHCRFEAKALYGIETVLVIDSDEFLLCPSADITIAAQRNAIQQMIELDVMKGYEQLLLLQVMASNRTDNLFQCMTNVVKKGQPIFDCFAHSRYYGQTGFPKAIHLLHACPLTDMHSACDFPGITSHDCLCKTDAQVDTVDDLLDDATLLESLSRSNTIPPKQMKQGCFVYHLSMNTGPRQSHLRGMEFWAGRTRVWQRAKKDLSELSLLARKRAD